MCVHKKTGHFYIGYREKNVYLNLNSDIDLPMYKTSSKYVNPFFTDYEWKILAEFYDGEAAYEFEQFLINKHWDNPLLINKHCFYEKRKFRNGDHSEEIKTKISQSLIGKKKSKEHTDNIRLSKLGKKLPPRSLEHRQKISIAKTGSKRPPVTEETRKKLSITSQGRKLPPFSEEHRKKLSEAAKRRHQRNRLL